MDWCVFCCYLFDLHTLSVNHMIIIDGYMISDIFFDYLFQVINKLYNS